MISNFSVIGIDEGQFVNFISFFLNQFQFHFDFFFNFYQKFSDILEFCEKLANNGKIVIIAALDATFQRKVIFLLVLSHLAHY
jgi:thymidine kinase